MKIINLLLAATVLVTACNNKPAEKKETEKPKDTIAMADTAKTQMVGNDKDEHGCIGSAGYQWSVVKNDCIRIFEAGTRLSAAEAVTNKTVAAFAILSSDNTKAEVFVPQLSASGIILEQSKDNAKVWAKDDWSLEKTAKGLQLKKGTVVQYAE